MSTYKKLRDGLLLLLHPGPCSCDSSVCICGAFPAKRIKEDKLKCMDPHITAVHNVHGVVVEGLGNRNGARRLAAQWSLVHERRGGARPTRKQRPAEIEAIGMEGVWIHPRARAAWNELGQIDNE